MAAGQPVAAVPRIASAISRLRVAMARLMAAAVDSLCPDYKDQVAQLNLP